LEKATLARLYETYGYLVHRRCLSLLKNAQDADDALQEIFVRVQRYGKQASVASELWRGSTRSRPTAAST
jgi:RNA polymerase sigma-70 factor (ECF subfamily)